MDGCNMGTGAPRRFEEVETPRPARVDDDLALREFPSAIRSQTPLMASSLTVIRMYSAADAASARSGKTLPPV